MLAVSALNSLDKSGVLEFNSLHLSPVLGVEVLNELTMSSFSGVNLGSVF